MLCGVHMKYSLYSTLYTHTPSCFITMRRQIAPAILIVLMLFGGTTFSNPRAANAAIVDVTTSATLPPQLPPSLSPSSLPPTATNAPSSLATADEPQQVTISLPTYQPPNRLMPSTSSSPMPPAISSSSSTTTTSGPMRATLLARPANWDSVAIESQRRNAVTSVGEPNSIKVQPLKRRVPDNAAPIANNAVVDVSTTHKTPIVASSTPVAPLPSKKRASSSASSVQTIPSAKSQLVNAAAAAAESPNALPSADKPVKSVQGTAPTDAYECPKDEYFQLFPTRCSKHSDCGPRNGDEFRCCKQIGGRRCVKAQARPLPEPKHEPILGVIPRKCPREPLAELFWDLQTCDTDRDCWPRVCCPDGAHKYCRTAQPELEKSTLSVARQLSTPLESVTRYIQCTPPPPAVFDQFPKKCNSTFDCFPNVCCQEAGRRHCRPPRRSLLSLLTGFASRFNTGIIRQWTQNIVIR